MPSLLRACCSHRQQGARLQIPLCTQQVLSCSTQDRREQELQVRSLIHAGVGERLSSLGEDCAPAQPHLQLQLGVRPSPGINFCLQSNKDCRIADLAIKIRSLSDTTAQQTALVAQSTSWLLEVMLWGSSSSKTPQQLREPPAAQRVPWHTFVLPATVSEELPDLTQSQEKGEHHACLGGLMSFLTGRASTQS